MRSPDQFRLPTRRYRQRGDNRPSLKMLEGLTSELQGTTDTSVQVTLADMRIDMAMQDPVNRAAHLSEAQSLLKNAVRVADNLVAFGTAGRTTSEPSITNGIRARLRLAELPSWKRVSQGSEPQDDYFRQLEAASHASEYAPYGIEAKARLIEFVPILLGARAIDQGDPNGLRGRLALDREDRRPFLPTDANPNWDFGIVEGRTSEAFDKPVAYIQVKSSDRPDDGSYSQAGIVVLSAAEHGFDDPFAVINDCLDEYQTEVPGMVAEQTARLDAITRSIGSYLGIELLQAG